MKKIMGILFVICLVFTSCDSKNDQQSNSNLQQSNKKTITVGISVDYPPFAFYKNGEMVGFEVDLIKKIAKKNDYELIIKDMSFDSLIGALQAKRIDLAISAISSTPDREKAVDFTTPYHDSYSVIITKADSGINSIDDLHDKCVGVQSGTTYEAYVSNELKVKIKNLKHKTLAKIPDLLQEYKSSRIDAIIMGCVEGKALIESQKNLKMITIDNTKVTYAVALPKGSDLLNVLNDDLQWLKKSGELEKLDKKYFN
jgi:polar amino acid transport system substrate-binding protein